MVWSYAPAPLFYGSPVSYAAWLLLKVKLTALCITESAERKDGHHLPKLLYLSLFTVNSQEQIIIINKNNLQGDQILDINKDLLTLKKARAGCGCPLPGGGRSWASVTGEGWGLSEAPLESAPPGWTSAPSAQAPSLAITECLQFLNNFKLLQGVFTPCPRLWALGRAWIRGNVHLLIEEGCPCTISLPAQLPSVSGPVFLPASLNYWHFKNSRMHCMVDISSSRPSNKHFKRSCIPSHSSRKSWQTCLFSVFLVWGPVTSTWQFEGNKIPMIKG